MWGKLFEGEVTRVYLILSSSSSRVATSLALSRRGLFFKRGATASTLEPWAGPHPPGPASLPAHAGGSVGRAGPGQERRNSRQVPLREAALRQPRFSFLLGSLPPLLLPTPPRPWCLRVQQRWAQERGSAFPVTPDGDRAI